MGKVSQSSRAIVDLDEIWLHVALDNPTAADRLIDRLVLRCAHLADFPNLGPARPAIAPDARVLTVGDYVILYRLEGSNAQIIRVVHGARRLEGLFDDGPGGAA